MWGLRAHFSLVSRSDSGWCRVTESHLVEVRRLLCALRFEDNPGLQETTVKGGSSGDKDPHFLERHTKSRISLFIGAFGWTAGGREWE